MPQVAIINDTSVLSDNDVQAIVPALQIQVTRDFAPWYGIAPDLLFVPRGAQSPAAAWPLVLSDSADQPGALGYHMTKQGKPWGIVGVKDDMAAGGSVSVTLSHELLEMLYDPYVTSVVVIDTQMGGFRGSITAIIAQEVCDACEADQFGYDINGVKVSDFVLPWWFGGEVPTGSEGKYSFTGALKEAFAIDRRGQVSGLLTGGYIGIRQFRAAGGWTTVNAAMDPGVEHFCQIVDQLLPSRSAHVLLANNTTQTDVPKFSRRQRVLDAMSQ